LAQGSAMGAALCQCDQKSRVAEDDRLPEEPRKESDDESEDDSDDDVSDIEPQTRTNYRGSVSAEAYGEYNKPKEAGPLPFNKKTPEQEERLRKAISSCFVFGAVDQSDMPTLIGAFEEQKIAAGQDVIKQGSEVLDGAPGLYVLEQGTAAAYKAKGNEAAPGTKVFTYTTFGQYFGELALLYNAPRAATVKTETDCVLWSIDRTTFNQFVKGASQKKREMYVSFLGRVDVLQKLSNAELSQVADALRERDFNAGDFIVKEGDQGSEFYIIHTGAAVAEKEGQGQVMEYKAEDYFGELALLNDAPRAASIKATQPTKVVCLERAAFKRLMGPLDNILAQRAKTIYAAKMKQ